MTRRGLVLGGGGTVGLAWEIGLVVGLLESGLELAGAGRFVGTSAGSIVSAWLASGRDPVSEAPSFFSRSFTDGLGPDAAPDPAHLARFFARWSAIERYTPADGREIGAIAREAPTAPEQAWVDVMTGVVGDGAFPDTLQVTALDTATGQVEVFDASRGVPLAVAVAASCSVPAVFPAVEAAGRRYTDGSISTSTHAHLCLEIAPQSVLVIAPFDARTPGIGGLMQREREREIALLREAGVGVVDIAPSDAASRAMGPNAMDAARQGAAFEAGREQGRQDAGLPGLEAWKA